MPRAFAALLLLPLALTLTACDSIDGGGSSHPPSNDPPQVGDIPRPRSVPSSADNVQSGFGSLRFRAPHEGRVWVANTTRVYEIIAVDVKRNDEIKVRPDDDRVELNGQTIYSQNLEKKHQHAIFYRETGSSWGGPKPYANIPRTADWVAGGSGSFEWRADRHATIYLGDDKTKTVILTSRVRPDDLVEIDAKRDFVRVNGRDIYNKNLESKHNLSIFAH